MTLDVMLPSQTGAASTRNLVGLLTRAWKVRTTGAAQVPKSGPVLLLVNHTGLLDGPLVVGSCPRPVHLLAASDAFVAPWDGLLRRAGQVPLDYEVPDRTALRTAVALLAEGRVVGMFPEARRGRGDVAHVRHEAAYVVAASDALVVPVAVLGTRKSGQRSDALPRVRARLDVVFGEPFRPPVEGDSRRRAVLARTGELLRQRLADHVAMACLDTGQSLPADAAEGESL